MRIAISINTSWNIYNFRKGLVKSLLSEGHKVIAISPRDGYEKYFIDWGCEYEHLPITSTGINPVKEVGAIFTFRSILVRKKVDILLCYTIKSNIYGTLAAKTLGIPTITNVSGLGMAFLKKGWVSSIARKLYGYSLNSANFIFFQNENDKEDLCKILNIDKSKTSVIPGSGINLSEFEAEEFEPAKNIKFIMIARLLVEKGVKEYAGAARRVKKRFPNVKFILIGSLDKKHSRAISLLDLEQWIKEGLIDYLPHSDLIKQEIEKADVVVLPSYREGTSRTLLEGAALGRPLITTNVPGCNNVVKHGINGFLCKEKDELDLARQMINFIELSTQEKKEMGKKSREIIEENFDERIVIESYLNKINELTS